MPFGRQTNSLALRCCRGRGAGQSDQRAWLGRVEPAAARSGRAAFVSMVETADFRDRHDVAVTGWHDRTGNRRVLVQRQVSPCFFVVRTVQRHQLPSTGFAEHDHVIETFATRRSHKSLDERILPRGVRGRDHFLNPHRLRGGRERVERVVPIMVR